MALLDVSDALTDPELLTRLVCERNPQVVGDNGIASIATTKMTFYGVVCSAGGSELQRLPEGERHQQTISIVTKFALTDGGDGNTADVVQFSGKRYTVKNVDPYQHFGQGFTQALCSLIPLGG